MSDNGSYRGSSPYPYVPEQEFEPSQHKQELRDERDAKLTPAQREQEEERRHQSRARFNDLKVLDTSNCRAVKYERERAKLPAALVPPLPLTSFALASSHSMSPYLEGVPVPSAAFSGDLERLFLTFFATLPRARPDADNLLLTTVVPPYGSFSVALPCVVEPLLSHDIVLGIDWAVYLRETFLGLDIHLDNMFDRWLLPFETALGGFLPLSFLYSANDVSPVVCGSSAAVAPGVAPAPFFPIVPQTPSGPSHSPSVSDTADSDKAYHDDIGAFFLSRNAAVNIFRADPPRLIKMMDKHHIQRPTDLTISGARHALIAHILSGSCIGSCDPLVPAAHISLSVLLSGPTDMLPDTHVTVVSQCFGWSDDTPQSHSLRLRNDIIRDMLLRHDQFEALANETVGNIEDPSIRMQLKMRLTPVLRKPLDDERVQGYALNGRNFGILDEVWKAGSTHEGIAGPHKKRLVEDFNLEISGANQSTFICGSCWEDCPILQPIRPTTVCRGRLECFTPSVFGEVEWVGKDPVAKHQIVRFGMPRGTNCRMEACYTRQYAALSSAIETEQTTLGGKTTDTWFEPQMQERKNLCFYVDIAGEADWETTVTFPVGEIFGLWSRVTVSDQISSHRSGWETIKGEVFTAARQLFVGRVGSSRDECGWRWSKPYATLWLIHHKPEPLPCFALEKDIAPVEELREDSRDIPEISKV
ncbi:hypothetical protein C8R43DRAFT_965325 [Mycena crocata]|nr:hypothetical protein C8R43DRAFT_965325 [Mycena crocata]